MRIIIIIMGLKSVSASQDVTWNLTWIRGPHDNPGSKGDSKGLREFRSDGSDTNVNPYRAYSINIKQ